MFQDAEHQNIMKMCPLPWNLWSVDNVETTTVKVDDTTYQLIYPFSIIAMGIVD
jgi:hypothetical protein